MSRLPDKPLCPEADCAAYLDGELDAAAAVRFESHLRACEVCAARVREQRALLCELDFLLGREPAPALPDNFAELVTVRAQSDLRGVRQRAERRTALRLCLVLGLFAVALLGGAWREAVWQPLRVALQRLGTVADFAGNALYDTGAGIALLSRHIGRQLLFQSGWQTAAGILLLLLLFFWLARLIGDYHHTHPAD
jgi:predicted anti-sigma-YlaC factor YlaD